MKYQLADNRLTMKHYNYFIPVYLLKKTIRKDCLFLFHSNESERKSLAMINNSIPLESYPKQQLFYLSLVFVRYFY